MVVEVTASGLAARAASRCTPHAPIADAQADPDSDSDPDSDPDSVAGHRHRRRHADPGLASSSPWFVEEQVRLANTAGLSGLTVTIVVQRTPGVAFSGQYNTIGGQVTQASSSTASAITYTFTLAAGQTLGAGSGWTFAAQASGTGTAHPTAGDTFAVSYTAGGASFTQSGHF